MLFSSTVFLGVFLPVVLIVYYGLLRRRRWGQNIFLLLASLFFYWWGEPKFVLIMLASIAMNYLFGLWVEAFRTRGRRLVLPVACTAAANIAVLFTFKYVDFTVRNLNFLGFDLTPPGIVLPIGISFFTFQAMSYVFDVARGHSRAQRNPLNVGLYIALFPQLVAGPIVKYETVEHEILHRRETWADFSDGVRRFLIGLGKKVLIANQMAVVADAAFDAASPSAALAWLGAVCYTLQIYYDFSGYSDMAIGLGRMFGFHFLENFNWPYVSKTITEFWRRWHISLSTWFRDYVYIPLGGSRVDRKWKLARNLFVVWLLTGVWHGASWTFVAWGMLYFVLLAAEKFWGVGRGWPALAGHVYTLVMVNFAWVLFRAEDMGAAARYLAAMFGANGWWEPLAGFYFRENIAFLAAALFFAVPTAKWLRGKAEASRLAPLWSVLYALGLLAVFAVAMAYLVKGTYNPFIYFNF